LALAREYGFESWSKLKRHVQGFADRQAAFFQAVRAGDRDRVRAALREDPSLVSARSSNDFDAPALNLAASRNDIPMIDLLLDHGADINARSTWWAGGFGPLDFTNEEVSRYLVRRGATLTAHAASRLGLAGDLREIVGKNPEVVHERGGDGQMPLHFAATPEIVDILVDAGADLEARDIDHEGTPAQHAILNEPVLRRLLERGAQPDVFIATRLADAEMLSRMLDMDPGALERAAGKSGNPQVPVAPGAHIYTYSLGFVWLPQVADRFGHPHIYQLLFERCSPRLKLLFSCWRGDGEVVHELLREHPDLMGQLSKEDQQLLPHAAWQRNTSAVRLMLEIGFDPNVRGGEESTAVDRAAFHGFDDVIEAILPHGPDLTVVNAYGGTPLTCCIYGSIHSWRKDGNFPRSVELLIEAGAALPSAVGGSPAVQEVLRRHVAQDPGPSSP
jgi:ankyrin repeat protein